uniref:Uncharacterized protein n=1 Tax=Romanomermis culicivorax TaxID=13658 RepID=A0A915JC72_ROMCU
MVHHLLGSDIYNFLYDPCMTTMSSCIIPLVNASGCLSRRSITDVQEQHIAIGKDRLKVEKENMEMKREAHIGRKAGLGDLTVEAES